ncbi:MAG: hypothetical protein V9H25_19475 [Candidatus Competibacter sp.]|mgnify:CR=1 FL=1
MLKVYEEIIDFIAAGSSPRDVSAFTPSVECRDRIADLLHRDKIGELSLEEKSELDHCLQIEHLMRLAKARARQHLIHEH